MAHDMEMHDNFHATLIQFKRYKFLITAKPAAYTMFNYIYLLKKHHVSGVVRVCDPEYDTAFLTGAGLDVYSLVYEDGMGPPQDIIDGWFEIVKKKFEADPDTCLAVHCVCGLGRSPVLVAITLIELGMKNRDVVKLIRSKKRGAFNTKQLKYLEKYRPSGKLRYKALKFCKFNKWVNTLCSWY